MKKFISLAVVLFVLLLVSSVTAQTDSTLIEYGQTVTGEITNQNFEVPYTFKGAQGDVIVIEMLAVDPLGALSLPSIILLDADFNMLATVYGFSSAVLVAQIPADGDYNVLATRSDGRAGESVGEYTLTVLKPAILIPDEAVEGTVTSTMTNYYVVEATGPFSVIYERGMGDFHPEISVQRISDTNELEEVSVLSGKLLGQGKIGVEAISEPYFVILKEGLWDFNFEEVSAEYIITLAP